MYLFARIIVRAYRLANGQQPGNNPLYAHTRQSVHLQQLQGPIFWARDVDLSGEKKEALSNKIQRVCVHAVLLSNFK